ncbi:hypothetical protein U9M48_027755 [Paspalum notatum var. saurae]|uniref:Uncharacterized protein n=1 Tax=Paspalum notatum var. saurae TaxID=547442 RepID=A0AAQ3TTJ6_PASNO
MFVCDGFYTFYDEREPSCQRNSCSDFWIKNTGLLQGPLYNGSLDKKIQALLYLGQNIAYIIPNRRMISRQCTYVHCSNRSHHQLARIERARTSSGRWKSRKAVLAGSWTSEGM